MSAVLVDTNVLVYAADRSDPVKHAAALEVLSHLGPERICVSVQSLSEYSSVLTNASKLAMSGRAVALSVTKIAEAWRVLPVDAVTVSAALDARDRWGLPFYDAQIWACAALNAIPVVLSEDFSAGSTLGGVRFSNPFAEEFDPCRL